MAARVPGFHAKEGRGSRMTLSPPYPSFLVNGAVQLIFRMFQMEAAPFKQTKKERKKERKKNGSAWTEDCETSATKLSRKRGCGKCVFVMSMC
jgi:hypothetical protein